MAYKNVAGPTADLFNEFNKEQDFSQEQEELTDMAPAPSVGIGPLPLIAIAVAAWLILRK